MRSKNKTEMLERVQFAKRLGYIKFGKWWTKPIKNCCGYGSDRYIVNPDDYPKSTTDGWNRRGILPTRNALKYRLPKSGGERKTKNDYREINIIK